ncbi:MAG: Rrf2 family transcriptional regulator [Abitibacteriaceae bacterium]|nr:Rrf2 family transcriptional regulator [Abditibacteriaceae bacterium]MBV9868985.1 Rrf2 family transcriptional regulator [Abditibacteriaceae bacterium]
MNSHFVLAVHLMLVMARRGTEPMTSADAARSINSNPVFLRRVMRQLARAGLVVTQTGPTGGSRLARAAAEITLGDIYRAVEPENLFALHAQTPNPKCPIGSRIQRALLPTLSEAEQALQQTLERKTLAQQLEELQRLPR